MHRRCERQPLDAVAAGISFLTILILAAPTRAQTVYQWTDDKGVIHFSNSAPPNGVAFERRNMPAVAPITSGQAPAAAPDEGADAAAGAGNEGKPSGPPQLVIESPESVREGPNIEGFSGKVKNIGGAPARNAAVQIIVMDPVQGDECLLSEMQVRPSTIGPGESGQYAGTFENPCFFGEARVELTPVWNR